MAASSCNYVAPELGLLSLSMDLVYRNWRRDEKMQIGATLQADGCIKRAESGGSGIVSRRIPGQPGGAEQFVMKVPNNKVGLIIGKGGETIKNMQASTGARIQVLQEDSLNHQ